MKKDKQNSDYVIKKLKKSIVPYSVYSCHLTVKVKKSTNTKLINHEDRYDDFDKSFY